MSIGICTEPERTVWKDEPLQMFLDRAIHDLRASARQIGASAGFLSESLHKRLDPGSEGDLRRLENGVAGMNLILTAMSSYALALSAANYTFRSVCLKTALSSALAHLREPISATGAMIAQEGLPEVTGDADRLREVFQHLIGNALRYRTEERPRIEVWAKREPERWLVAVRDNGIGFEPRYWDHVFAPFYRLHGAEIPGVGMGLTICRRILEMHHGKMWIESQKGSGTTCFFTLPADESV